MEDVIAPISKELLKAELTEEKRLRMTNRSHNQIYHYASRLSEYNEGDRPFARDRIPCCGRRNGQVYGY